MALALGYPTPRHMLQDITTREYHEAWEIMRRQPFGTIRDGLNAGWIVSAISRGKFKPAGIVYEWMEAKAEKQRELEEWGRNFVENAETITLKSLPPLSLIHI